MQTFKEGDEVEMLTMQIAAKSGVQDRRQFTVIYATSKSCPLNEKASGRFCKDTDHKHYAAVRSGLESHLNLAVEMHEKGYHLISKEITYPR